MKKTTKKKLKAKKISAKQYEQTLKTYKGGSKVTVRKDEKGCVHLSGRVKLGTKVVKLAPGLRPVNMELPLADTKAKPTLEQLNVQAAKNLVDFRKQLEKEVEDKYCGAKWREVKRLAEEAGVDRMLIADITKAEGQQLKVKKP